jgi:hypothetical protein
MGGEATDGELMTVLKGSSLLSSLREEQLRVIAKMAKQSDFERDQMIFREGDTASFFYVILSGLVEVRRSDQPVARLGPGQFFGETTLVNDSTRSMSVFAVRPTRCMMLSGSELRSLPAVVVKVLAEATRRTKANQPQAGAPAIPTREPTPASGTAIAFKSEKAKLLFDCLAKFFMSDYMVKRLYLEQAGWRTLGELSTATKIPHATLYGQHGNYGPPVTELVSRGLIETRVFSGQRGRGGEILRVRIAYDKEPVKRYVDRVVLQLKSDDI